MSRRLIDVVYKGETHSIAPSFAVIDAMEQAANMSIFHLPVLMQHPRAGQIARIASACFRVSGYTGKEYSVDAIGEELPVGDTGQALVAMIAALTMHYVTNAKELQGGGGDEKKQPVPA